MTETGYIYEKMGSMKVPVKHWTRGVQLEKSAREQLFNVASLPFIHKHVAAMPDVHWGMGATIGSVIATHKAIIPAAVGVDIGCGMMAVKTGLTADMLPDNLKELRTEIESKVPHGRTNNGGKGDRGAWHDVPNRVTKEWELLGPGYDFLKDLHPKAIAYNNINHLGTLGTGNHFVEICLDEENNVWAMLHSGSRGCGNRIGMYFIQKAKKEMEKWHIQLPDQNLAYLPEGSEFFKDYIFGVKWAQDFAYLNREIMMRAVIGAMRKVILLPFTVKEQAVNCHHNYVEKENHFGQNVWLTRKGAVRAREGDLGIIPGSMGTKSYIVRGKGNPESFHSCSHGAGRKMSRTEAKRRFTVADHVEATKGVECKKDESVIDETPMAYKDIDAVMEAQTDLVEIVHTLKQVICVKG